MRRVVISALMGIGTAASQALSVYYLFGRGFDGYDFAVTATAAAIAWAFLGGWFWRKAQT